MIAPDLPGKTYGQVQRLAVQAALTADPESAARRRQDAEQHTPRVHLFREETGAAGLAGRDLPTDQALAAHASVCARARQYKDSGAFPDDARMDQYRAAAYLDLLNGITADTRIATGQLVTVTRDAGEPDAYEREAGRQDLDKQGTGGRDCACRECDGSCLPADDDFPPDSDEDESPGDSGPDDGGPPGGPGGKGPCEDSGDGANSGDDPASPAETLSVLRLADLVLPLATLLGLAERPGEDHRLGPLDPGLCRDLAIAATGSPRTRLCVTVSGPDGTAVGHGCARPPGKPRTAPPARAGRPAARQHQGATGTSRPGQPDHHRRPPGRTSRSDRSARQSTLVIHSGRQPRTTGRLRHLDAQPARRQEPYREPGASPGARL